MKLKLRPYQEECIDAINNGPSKCLAVVGTGGGKSLIMSRLHRKGKQLVLVHREDLLHSNGENFDCPVGFEKGELVSNGEEVVIASVQSLMNRLDKFKPDEFDLVVADECHHYTALKYKEVIDYFTPRKFVGLTATVNRADGVGLESIVDEIVYEIGIEPLIKQGYLSKVKCLKADIGYDISSVARSMGDFNIKELERQVNIEGAKKAIKTIVDKYDGSSIIACVNVQHAEDLAEYCGGVAVTADTPNRMDIINDYKSGKITLLTTVNVLSEGSNLPIAKNLIMASPTQSSVKYIQLAGRVMRLHEQKDFCRIIDCVGNVGKHEICGAHTLLGLDIEQVPKSSQIELIGDLLDELPALIKKKADCPESWVKNIKTVELFAKKNKLNTFGINFFKHPDGSLICSLADNKWIGITPENHIGQSKIITSLGKQNEYKDTQSNIEEILQTLKKYAKDESPLWNTKSIKRWGREKAGEKQLRFANGLLSKGGFHFRLHSDASKMDASCIINRLKKNDIKTQTQPKREQCNERFKVRVRY